MTETAKSPVVRTWETEMTEEGRWVRSASAYHEVPPTSEADRYVVYGADACPWATRMKMLALMLGLEDAIRFVDCDPVFGVIDEATQRTGWVFSDTHPDPVEGASTLLDIYLTGNPRHDSKSTTPMLWDAAEKRVLHNESSELALILHDRFRALATHPEVDLYPDDLRGDIDAFYNALYEPLLNGVYRAGFAARQSILDAANDDIFSALDTLEARLSTQRWALGDRFTFADVTLFPTLWRFDFVYAIHFKCSRRRIRDYPALSSYIREMYAWPVVRAANHVEPTRRHYYGSHHLINPNRLVARVDLSWMDAPHGRDALPQRQPAWFMT